MKLRKILYFLIIVDFIFIIILWGIDDSVNTNVILEEVSNNGKYKISLTEEQRFNSKNIEVFLWYKKNGDLEGTFPYYMKIGVNNKCEISKSNFIINWYKEFLKITYKDSCSNTSKNYRIYFKDLEEDVEEKRM